MFDSRTGEIEEKRLQRRAEAEEFYRSLAGREIRVGREAGGHYPWFERLLEELGFELWFGDAARVRASEVRNVRQLLQLKRFYRRLAMRKNSAQRGWMSEKTLL